MYVLYWRQRCSYNTSILPENQNNALRDRISSMQQLLRGKHNKIRWVLSNYAQNLCCNLWGGVNFAYPERCPCRTSDQCATLCALNQSAHQMALQTVASTEISWFLHRSVSASGSIADRDRYQYERHNALNLLTRSESLSASASDYFHRTEHP